MTKLYDFALEPRFQESENLYYHRETVGFSFDTYYNSISLQKIKRHTTINELIFSRVVDIYTENGYLKTSDRIYLNEISDGASMLYIRSLEMPDKLSVEAIGRSRDVYLAIIICTFHRYEYVKNNIDYFCKYCVEVPCNIILVDNGSEIDKNIWKDERITVLHRVNNGGSGGFSAGMQYAAQQGKYTHILMMDDDVIFDRVAIQKLYGFLSFLKEEYSDLCIAGSMLYTDEPTIQFECGGMFGSEGKHIGYGYRYDMADRKCLLDNEEEHKINYGGWWMFCMPVKYALQGNFPAPFFVKYDDIEYALRCNLKILTLNGIGLWHENFDSKYNSMQEYFNVRNYLFLRKWCTPGFDDKTAFHTVRHFLLEKMCRQQYKMAEAVLIAYEDYLRGETYLAQIDYEEKLKMLRKLDYVLMDEKEIFSKYGVKFERQLYLNCNKKPFRRYMQPLLYGHLIPRLMCRNLTITDVLVDRKEHYFGANKVLHYCVSKNVGYITKRKIRFFIYGLVKLKIIWWRDRWKKYKCYKN